MVVGDGRISIGLWPHGIDRPTLVFVCEELGKHVDTLRHLGLKIDTATVGVEQFNSLNGRLPNGIGIRLIEALTHSPQAHAESHAGWFAEIAFGRSIGSPEGWESLGLIALDLTDETPSRMAVISDTLNLGFYPGQEFGDFWLSFECEDLPSRAAKFEVLGVDHIYESHTQGQSSIVVTGPEGTRLVLRQTA